MPSKRLVPFAQRPPTKAEIEILRLILSTFQDGSGQHAGKTSTLPGWRDFERAFALAFEGIPQENKGFFDVLLPNPDSAQTYFGCSCKMRGTFDQIAQTGRACLEISNAAGEFWLELGKANIDAESYRKNPRATGEILLTVLERWRQSEGLDAGGSVDLRGSYYYALQWSPKSLTYQLFQFPMALPKPKSLKWYCPPSRVRRGIDSQARCVRADDDSGLVIEWYGQSGGQLKYYPPVSTAIWASPPFKLEPLPADVPHAVWGKITQYFPRAWKELRSEIEAIQGKARV